MRSGAMPLCEFHEAESCMTRSAGHCMTMGTASTMASVVEALGIGLPTNAAIPAVDSRRYALRTWPDAASSRWSTKTCGCRKS